MAESLKRSPAAVKVSALKGVGPAREAQLAEAGIQTVEDLLLLVPRTYRVLSDEASIASLRDGDEVTVSGTVVTATVSRPRGRRRRSAIAEIEDDTGRLRVTWFGQGYLKSQLKKGRQVTVEGRVRLHREKLSLAARFYEFDSEAGLSRKVVALYPLPEGFPRRTFAAMIDEALERYGALIKETFPEAIRRRRALPDASSLLRLVHRPETLEQAAEGRRALVYEELFIFEAAMALRKRAMACARTQRIQVVDKVDARIRALFPFTFTSAQDRVIREIAGDLARATPMNRLLQGDVGSGKTVVALYAMLAAVAAGRQAALMAPTEILAEQHHRVIARALANARTRLALITSSMKSCERREALDDLARGAVSIAIGTQALLSKAIAFKDLGVVIIDEQHKFGVLQRQALSAKGDQPHTLVMTATPIPRTLALTIFADIGIATIDTLPPGRKPVRTRIVPARQREEAYDLVRQEVGRGRQAYVVYPLVAASEKLGLPGAIDGCETLARGALAGLRVGLIHGAMNGRKKDAVMDDFASRKFDVLVATTVIEVGVDVPNATAMVVESAERYGLAQLHQLRGRVGRGTDGGVCLLVPSEGASCPRLKVLCETNDGFAIANEDMKLRGPGEFFGVQQHGLPNFQLADVVHDWELLQQARDDAFDWAATERADRTSRIIKHRIARLMRGRDDLVHVG